MPARALAMSRAPTKGAAGHNNQPLNAVTIKNKYPLPRIDVIFIPDLSTITKLIIELLKKGVKFVWSEDCEKDFHMLRQHLTTTPVLVQPDNSKPFEVFCDASGTSLGCVLI
jgi:hypothetical protein